MEEKQLELVKPEFNGEIQAKIKSVGEIESNMKEVKGYVEELNDYYKNINFTEETMKEAKDEKAKVNKFKTQVADYRKNIVAEYNKPIKIFEDTAKETEKLLTDTYNTINQQVAIYEGKLKKEKEEEVRNYFEEYKESLNIDFISFEDTKIKVNLSDSKTSLKKQAKDFIDKVNMDLATIALQRYRDEILVEYKQNGFILNNAITTVLNRQKAIEETKKKEEEKKITIISNKEHEITKKSYEQLEEVFNKPLEQPEEVKQEEILTLKFTVRGSREKLKELKNFLIQGGYDYE